jgi:hypothetical protein
MASKTKAEKEREAADRIAGIMYAALIKLPKEDQAAAVRDIENTKINRPKRRSPSKRSSTPQNLRGSQRVATNTRKSLRP